MTALPARRIGLVLGRRPGEALVLALADGRRIVVRVTEVRPGRTRLGIDAPADVAVHREEVLAEVEAARLRADELAAQALARATGAEPLP